jgi:hypothetical protein
MHDQSALEREESTGMESAPEFDLALYPRTYRMSLQWRLLIVICSALLAVGGLLSVGYFALTDTLTAWGAAFIITLCATFSCLGLYGLLSAIQYRVILTADAIEVIEPFGRRRLSREEIKGWRLQHPGQGFSVLVLVPANERTKSLKITQVLKTDDAFDPWFSQIPDLQAQERLQTEAELEHTFYPDLPPQERTQRISRLRQLATGVNAAALALSVAAFFWTDPDHLLFATLVVLPWLAIWMVARFQPLYCFGGRSEDHHPDLTPTLLMPGFLLTLRTLSEVNTLDWEGPVLLACAGGLALTGAAVRIDPWLRTKRWIILLLGLMTCVYGYGAGLELNALADKSSPRVYRVTVLAKHISRDSKSTTWYLTLPPWGPITRGEDVSVSAARYQRTQPGDTVCVLLRSGALQIAWYQIATCSEARPGEMGE